MIIYIERNIHMHSFGSVSLENPDSYTYHISSNIYLSPLKDAKYILFNKS